MRTWYTYRIATGKVSFRFRADRKSFEDSLTMQDYIFYWREMAPIIFKQLMVEAELTRKYKS